MPGARQRSSDHDEVRRADHRRDAEKDDAQREHIDVDAGIVGLGGVGDVVEPAAVRRLAERDARHREDAREQVDPVAQRVEARKRHVARAEQQRPQEVRKARQHRQRVKEDHRHAVHREELIIGVRRQHLQVRLRQLDAHGERFDAADQQEEERRAEIADADPLVIDGRQPAVDARAPSPRSRAACGALARMSSASGIAIISVLRG